MKKLQVTLLCLCMLVFNFVQGQNSQTIKEYISKFKDAAIAEMHRTGVPAAIKLAQGIHETGAGTSKLVLSSNNHFGIKCKTEWKGDWVSHDDDAKGECFRKYEDPYQSYQDHSDFLKTRKHYASLFLLDPTDYEGWAHGLKKAGYATNPKYPQIIIKLIKDYNLQDYTLIALNRIKDPNEADYASVTFPKEVAPVSKPVFAVGIAKPRKEYPSGVFTINETKVVLVEKGTSFLKVAEENNISLFRLFDYNEMKEQEVALEDQLIFLQRKRKTGAKDFHVVANGETLTDIAQDNGIRKENLLEYNFLSEGMQPEVGEKLYLKTKAPSMPKLIVAKESYSSELASFAYNKSPEVETSEASLVFHVVQSKETLFAISKKYEVETEDVLKWNELSSSELKVGQQLRIYKRSANVYQGTR